MTAEPQVEIRPERPGDAEAVRRVNEWAFGRPDEAGLVDRLRLREPAYLALVAALGSEVVGHIAFTPVTLDPGRPGLDARGLAPMAVLPEHQRSGIGSRLVMEGLDFCRRDGAQAVVVLGHPEYYPRFGFTPGADLGIRWEHDAPSEAFLVLELEDGVLDGVRGVVRYHPAFGE